MVIETKRLKLVGHSPTNLLALIRGSDDYMQSFGYPAAHGLREFMGSSDVSPEWLKQLQHATSTDVWVHGFGLLHVVEGKVIGCGGFKGAPDGEGVVEIAYGVAPSYQGNGYATEAAEALAQFAVQNGAKRVIAHTLPEKNASTRVLTKCGFTFRGEVIDPQDGKVWRWERLAG